MTTKQKELYTLLKDEGNQLFAYIDFLQKEGDGLKEQNLILDLEDLNDLEAGQLNDLLPFSNAHREKGKSLVVVTNAVAIEEIPEELSAAPTIGEAEDLIQMEEIERDLGF